MGEEVKGRNGKRWGGGEARNRERGGKREGKGGDGEKREGKEWAGEETGRWTRGGVGRGKGKGGKGNF